MEQLLNFCKFYKGQKENPFNWETDNYKNQFWEYEKIFVNKFNIGIEFKGMTPKDA